MIKYVDRLLITGYLKAYLICLTSMLSLYVVVDLFTNIDELTLHSHGLKAAVRHIATYYAYQIPKIFDRLSEAIILLAAMFTVAWMQRNNELLPLLSAGMSTRRVVLPVIITACLMLGLTLVSQELILPETASSLLNEKSDPLGKNDVRAQPAFEANGIHIDAEIASRKNLSCHPFYCVIPASLGHTMIHLTAAEARYIPPGSNEQHSGGWLLTGTQPAELPDWDNINILEPIDQGKYFLKTKEVDFETMTRHRNWFNLASTLRLYQELQKGDTTRVENMAVLFHQRLTRPILGIVLVVMGLSTILRDHNRNVFISAGLCLVLCGVFFTACFASKQLGDNDILAPALAAWLPVLSFGPLALTMFDAVHT
jgi:lipopolysaccharide export system permease protein